ncbi:hypothetical protein L1S34_08695 [Flavobacterium sp. K77]|uniref:hypothetical protein n=1 Tax=Flavobacterium sp. K77 TaxID=2910676 RepID=UPI001F3B52A7|nr:hypothetical protein [Flavobacterium sp. K77]MCF6141363.1 hypothetical protein [Flavobacterium sp. K77]
MHILIFIPILLVLISCKKENIEGIAIGKTLLENQSFADNKKLADIIKSTLKGDYDSLRRLNHFQCGDGAGCYDKGFLITQIIYKIGENNFNKMIDKLDRKELNGIEDFINTGLEYGDNNNDGKMDNKIADEEFPLLMKKLSEK